jgi:cell division protein FtsZ
MNEMGVALMGTGTASGEDRATDSARAAISSPLLEDLSIDGARGVLINITGNAELTLFEVNEASTLIQEAAHEDANIIFGAVIDDSMPEGEMRVTVIATGLDDRRVRRGLGQEFDGDARASVTPLRPEPTQQPMLESDTAPAAAAAVPPPARSGNTGSDDFVSPFDDELDVPTFLRRGGHAESDDDAEEPAFLRRSAD